MSELTSKFIEPDVQNAFTIHFTSKMEDEFKAEKNSRFENNLEMEEENYLEYLREEFAKDGNEKTYEIMIVDDEEDSIKETVGAYKENIQKEITDAENLIAANIRNAEKNL